MSEWIIGFGGLWAELDALFSALLSALVGSVVAEFDVRAVPFAADNHGVELGDSKVITDSKVRLRELPTLGS